MKKTFTAIVLIFIVIQLIQTKKTNPETDKNLKLAAPEKIMKILKKSCYDCHSYETKWPWYSNVAPLSWSIVNHVNDGRKALNFSTWKEIPKEIKTQRLKRAIKTINNEIMPLHSYLWFHKDAKLSAGDKKILSKWFKSELEKLRI